MSWTYSHLLKLAEQYCHRNGGKLEPNRALGFGVHGNVFVCQRANLNVKNALKIHERPGPYFRERNVYLRLEDLQIEEIEGHNVPQLLGYDDELRAIEMSIVVRPFVLDFGGAYLDRPPVYSVEIMEQWETDKREQFEDHWPKAATILETLRSYGIYVADVNPGNIGFSN